MAKFGVIESKNNKEAITEAYNTALRNGYNVWILPGQFHEDKIKTWLDTHKEEVKKKNIIFIGQDYTGKKENGFNTPGYSIFQEFKTKEAGFAAGYATAEFLSNEEKKEDRTFGTFGGSIHASVTDFIEGFLKGVLYWNTRPDHKDKNKTYSVTNTIDLDSGFEQTQKMDATVKKMIALNPKIILPVAGIASTLVLQELEKKTGKYMIGVDADQGFAATPAQKNLVFTSIIKSLGQATYDALTQITKVKDPAKLKENLGGFELGKADGKMFEGYNKNWVGVTKTHIKDKKELADKALELGEEVFRNLKENEKKWLNSSKMVNIDGQEESNLGLSELLNKLAAEINKNK
ncbi:Hypothetical protein MAU_1660 [Metamycoplasma auris 15026]|uniref:ABC transporter substrate-binding protein PnrA-like domain-containing protein n=1 Tax=Metamycoplasma auris 15026 TaxID=1188233 RepID=N9TSR7_9BACT|nr:BMP family ABC transporter substrate-binding protein [Metamycoplasma auris]ENY69125.1 Hypothetical protein MAU_1660 [Metamycoplasma auris 15026]